MAVPVIISVTPTRGPTLGGELVRVVVRDAAPVVAVCLGSRPVVTTAREVRPEGTVLWLAVPPLVIGAAPLVIENLDLRGQPIAGERAEWTGYEVKPTGLIGEGILVQITRGLLRMLRAHVVPAVRMAVAVDFDDDLGDGARLVPLAESPGLTLGGPVLELNRFYAPAGPTSEVVATELGLRIIERAPALTVDVLFEVTGSSRSAVELLNLMTATASFLARTRWLALPADPQDPSAGEIQWELELDGGMRSTVGGAEGVHVFSTQIRIRGVTLDHGSVTGQVTPATNETQLELSLGGMGVQGG